jgi:long-chain acyl-CoA synthetase
MESSLPLLLKRVTEEHPDLPLQLSKDENGQFQPTSYRDFYRQAQEFAAGLKDLGVARGDHVGLISDNRREWLVADYGVLNLGAADVPRGCDSTAQEVGYILGFSDCKTVLVENATQAEKVLSVKDQIPHLRHVVLLNPAASTDGLSSWGVKFHAHTEVMDRGRKFLQSHPNAIEEEISQGQPGDVATIIFTSGTTGKPKGVMLTHQNYLFQVGCIPERIDVTPGDVWLSVLPVWHSFERVMQYIIVGSASTIAYSKPIGQVMLEDFQAVQPVWMASVPRIWESVRGGVYRNVREQGGVTLALFLFFTSVGGAHATLTNMMKGLIPRFRRRSRVVEVLVAVLPFLLLYPVRALGDALVFRKIRARLGGRFVAGISGGGALPPAVDRFFQAANVLLLEGYGLTETAPVLAVRRQHGPVPGTVGPMLPDTEVRILDEQGNELSPGRMGLIVVRGPQIMKGYYNQEEATEQVMLEGGWLDTGDLGMVTHRGELKITGRAKDTIVLLGGENVEPLPIEQKLLESDYVDQAVVLGQDQKYLAALLVPNEDQVKKYAADNAVPYLDYENLLQSPEIQELFSSEVNALVSARNGFKGFERIFRFALLPKPFEVGKELSAKQEVKRHVVNDLYRKQIVELFT